MPQSCGCAHTAPWQSWAPPGAGTGCVSQGKGSILCHGWDGMWSKKQHNKTNWCFKQRRGALQEGLREQCQPGRAPGHRDNVPSPELPLSQGTGQDAAHGALPDSLCSISTDLLLPPPTPVPS